MKQWSSEKTTDLFMIRCSPCYGSCYDTVSDTNWCMYYNIKHGIWFKKFLKKVTRVRQTCIYVWFLQQKPAGDAVLFSRLWCHCRLSTRNRCPIVPMSVYTMCSSYLRQPCGHDVWTLVHKLSSFIFFLSSTYTLMYFVCPMPLCTASTSSMVIDQWVETIVLYTCGCCSLLNVQ